MKWEIIIANSRNRLLTRPEWPEVKFSREIIRELFCNKGEMTGPEFLNIFDNFKPKIIERLEIFGFYLSPFSLTTKRKSRYQISSFITDMNKHWKVLQASDTISSLPFLNMFFLRGDKKSYSIESVHNFGIDIYMELRKIIETKETVDIREPYTKMLYQILLSMKLAGGEGKFIM